MHRTDHYKYRQFFFLKYSSFYADFSFILTNVCDGNVPTEQTTLRVFSAHYCVSTSSSCINMAAHNHNMLQSAHAHILYMYHECIHVCSMSWLRWRGLHDLWLCISHGRGCCWLLMAPQLLSPLSCKIIMFVFWHVCLLSLCLFLLFLRQCISNECTFSHWCGSRITAWELLPLHLVYKEMLLWLSIFQWLFDRTSPQWYDFLN